jgi:hypothetical protein
VIRSLRAAFAVATACALSACSATGDAEGPPSPVPTPPPPPRARGTIVVDSATTAGTYGYFRYLGAWRHVRGKHDGRIGGASSMSTKIGDRATLWFYGSGVRVYGVSGRSGGFADVRLDGRDAGIRTFYHPTVNARALVFAARDLPRDVLHEVQLTVTGLHDPASRMDYVNVSGAAIAP